ncbi:hypothetical protein ACFE04_010048 [Oxalis oulophora]
MLALGRLGALCEQIKDLNTQEFEVILTKDLNTQGFEVILTTSGAFGCGRHRLRYRRSGANPDRSWTHHSWSSWPWTRGLRGGQLVEVVNCVLRGRGGGLVLGDERSGGRRSEKMAGRIEETVVV